jgi:hypothetical protein
MRSLLSSHHLETDRRASDKALDKKLHVPPGTFGYRPHIGPERERLESHGGRARWVCRHNGTLFTYRAAQESVFGDLADIIQLHGQESRGHALETLEQGLP